MVTECQELERRLNELLGTATASYRNGDIFRRCEEGRVI